MPDTSAPPDLQRLYTSVLRPRLEAVERDRHRLVRYIAIAVAFVVVPAFGARLITTIGVPLPAGSEEVLAVLGAVIALFKYAVPGVTSYLNYRARFKRDVVAELVKAVSPGSSYAADRCVTNSGAASAQEVYSRAMQSLGVRYEDADTGPRPSPPAGTRTVITRDADALVVRYGLPWWFVPCLILSAASACAALTALAGAIDAVGTTGAIEALTGRPSDLAAFVVGRWKLALLAALVVGALPTLGWATLARRVRLGRESFEVLRGLRPFPRRYPRSADARILQADKTVYLARARRFTVFNVTLSPVLGSAEEARWVAWELRRELAAHSAPHVGSRGR